MPAFLWKSSCGTIVMINLALLGGMKVPGVLEKIAHYEQLLNGIWSSSTKYLGAFSVKLLVERVVFDVAAEYREIELLKWDEEGISCQELAEALRDRPDFPIDDMFTQFITKYVEILAKLVGSEKAEKILEKIKGELGKGAQDHGEAPDRH